ncbi:MAG: alkaline phosphatase [Opitutales bacterium]
MSEIHSSTSRRRFLKGAGMAGLATTLLPGQSVAAQGQKAVGGKAKNLIFLVVDGMCNGTLGLAHHWNLRNRGELLNWMQLYNRPGLSRCFQDTASNSSPVTDSAAASAWGSGQRVDNGAINVAPGGKALEPLFARAIRAGKKTGLVSTCRVSHATPAGFAASVRHRGQEHAIISQYLEHGIDVILGGGADKFRQSKRDGSKLDYFRKFEAAGYQIARDAGQLKHLPAKGEPLLGIFSDSHIPYAIDRKNDRSLKSVPGLRDMFRSGLKHLAGSEEGFLLQVEAGRVDHAGHANDPGAILHEQLEFDACIPVALEFIEKHPDTMLIVTTDHGTGGCQLDGQGMRYGDSGPALDRMNQFNHSFEWLEDRFRAAGEFRLEPFKLATGITPNEAQRAAIQSAIQDSNVSYLSSKIANIFADDLGSISSVGWSSNGHTAENVDLLAFGPGSEQIPGFIQNNELFGIMTDALKI